MNGAHAYDCYTHINTPATGDCAPANVMSNSYPTLESLDGKFIVYNSKQYRVYPNLTRFMEHLAEMPSEERTFHEVIFDRPQKLKIDIDAARSLLADIDMSDVADFCNARLRSRPSPIQGQPSVESNTPDIVDAPPTDDSYLFDYLNQVFGSPSIPEIADNTAALIQSEDVEIQDEAAHKYGVILKHIIEAVQITFYATYGEILSDDSVIVCESTDTRAIPEKFSNHIIIDGYFVSSSAQAREFTSRLYSKLPAWCKPVIDLGVNKKTQNFRIAGCRKHNDTRVKRIIAPNSEIDPRHTIITYLDKCTSLTDIAEAKEASKFENTSNLSPDEVDKAMEICERGGIFEHHTMRDYKNGAFFFFRTIADDQPCPFCDRTHTVDNNLFVTVRRGEAGVISVFQHCIKYSQEHKGDVNKRGPIFLGEFVSDDAPPIAAPPSPSNRAAPTPTDEQISWSDKRLMRDIAMATDKYTTLFDGLDPACKHVYNESTLRPFELAPTLVVHAMMKMGKTKALKSYLARYFPDGLDSPVVRFISFRQTFSSNIKNKFPNFTSYSDVEGPLTQDKLIVQVESLWRLAINPGAQKPDVLILDECESIFEQFDSGLVKRFADCFGKFQYLMKYSKHVICMDANISDRTYRILRRMRPGFGRAGDTIYHHDTHQNACDDLYYMTVDKPKWLSMLYKCVENDEKIVIPTSSRKNAKTLHRDLTKQFPDKYILIYTSDTNFSIKREHFSDVDKYWSRADILIYTPTVSAGVSFEVVGHFDKMFCYFFDRSCPAETCIQMMGRVRDLGAKEYYICISALGGCQPRTLDAVIEHAYTQRENLLKTFDGELGITPVYGPFGEVTYHTTDYFHIWTENTLVKNLSINEFTRRLANLIARGGAKMKYLSDEVYEQYTGEEYRTDGLLNEETVALCANISDASKSIENEKHRAITLARDMDDDEADKIREAIETQEDIKDVDWNAFQKHELRARFKYNGDITEDFVRDYTATGVYQVYVNLNKINMGPTLDESLILIRNDAAAYSRRIMKSEEHYHHRDVQHHYTYDKHRYTIAGLRLCGWSDIYDKNYIHSSLVLEKLEADNAKNYWNIVSHAAQEFMFMPPSQRVLRGMEAGSLRLLQAMLRPINTMLKKMYGIQITCEGSGSCKIVPNSLFTSNPERAERLRLPLIRARPTTMADPALDGNRDVNRDANRDANRDVDDTAMGVPPPIQDDDLLLRLLTAGEAVPT